MQEHASNPWDPNKEKEIRLVLKEIQSLDHSGYFNDLELLAPIPADPNYLATRSSQITRAAPFVRKVSHAKPLDYPVVPPLAQFMTQISVSDRTEAYKNATHQRYQQARFQVRMLFEKIVRGEITSNAVIRSIVSSFMDTFMKDRNLILNLATAPFSSSEYLYDHSLKLCLHSLSLASAAGYSRIQSVELAQGALLADIGMMLVPEMIRQKKGALTAAELFEIKKHPMLSLTLLEKVQGLSETTLTIPYQHHERLTGNGYPDQRAGNSINKFSRIVAIADVFTALISKRSYRDSIIPYQAMVSLLTMGGKGLLDGEQIKVFLKALSIFPLGSLVRLSNGRMAKVVAPSETEFTKPTVSILTSEDGKMLPKMEIYQIDLVNSEINIVEALNTQTISHKIMDGF